eukprot:Mrub_10711.p1 GENE.Mrub_10711~~Mrub_10711.p1  ORF type:complete len:166 (-),score=25.78 Mrub_10711:165-626(-)
MLKNGMPVVISSEDELDELSVDKEYKCMQRYQAIVVFPVQNYCSGLSNQKTKTNDCNNIKKVVSHYIYLQKDRIPVSNVQNVYIYGVSQIQECEKNKMTNPRISVEKIKDPIKKTTNNAKKDERCSWFKDFLKRPDNQVKEDEKCSWMSFFCY